MAWNGCRVPTRVQKSFVQFLGPFEGRVIGVVLHKRCFSESILELI